MTPAQTHAAAMLPNEPPTLQADFAAYLADAAHDWMRTMVPHLLVEQVGAVDDAVCQRNDFNRKVA